MGAYQAPQQYTLFFKPTMKGIALQVSSSNAKQYDLCEL